MNSQNRSLQSSHIKLILFIVILLGLLYVFYKFSVVLTPIILSVILAYLFTPVVNKVSKRFKINRTLVVILVYILFILFTSGLVAIVAPMLVSQLRIIQLDLRYWLTQLSAFLDWEIVVGDFVFNGQDLLGPLLDSLQGLLEPLFGKTLDIVAALVESLVWIIFILIISFYFVKDSKEIYKWFEHLVLPEHREVFHKMAGEINLIWGAFFRGQLLLALMVCGIITLESVVLGLPFPLYMGLLAGLMEFFPSVGHGVWLVVASLMAILLGSTWIPLPNWAFLLIVLAVHIIFTQFDLNYLIPRVIGRSVHLPPMVVILGIVAGAAIAGVLGVVLAAPAIATVRLLSRYLYRYFFGRELSSASTTITPPLPPPELKWWRRTNQGYEIIEDELER